ncbi:D-alanyl-D-alanine carboxypeptidase family protein [Bradyrhizobium macuxiense]|uniref:D-alanyl-D-alanine carboxypeptidase family protein n=1 Tax=Bradyrhizobium macuxiense TaxID=1755647 RepID=UPI000AD46290|nr:D-alanyl-D-alanine carboxypeptidase family protein [Bradyrhizobium macuxiense]
MHPRLVVLSDLCRDVTMPVLVVLMAASSGLTGIPDNLRLTPATHDSPPSPTQAEFTVHADSTTHASADSPIADQTTASQPAASVQALATPETETAPPAASMPEPEAVPSSIPAPANISDSQTSDAAAVDEAAVEVVDECLVLEICVDRYLWTLYQRAPKEDTISSETTQQVTIKRKGKLVTKTKTITTRIDEDFAWKDAKAADKAGMTTETYVIGGMDADFKLKLFYMLHAAEKAGLSPGITSGFRDDYRQSIASGLKAANNRSYHGGSLRGGYGHGLAADIVSIEGATRAERLASTHVLWKWLDAHGSEFGIGRPYLDRDPPHVGPIDGEEYAKHRLGIRPPRLEAEEKQTPPAKRKVAKHARTAKL